MGTYRVRMQVELVLDQVDEFDAALRRLLGCLSELVGDADSVSTGEPHVVDVFATVTAYSPTDAVLAGTTSLRTAAHAAGAYTADWPASHDWHLWVEERAVEAILVDPGSPADPSPRRGTAAALA